jgi:CheY-like chemotaxis protein
LGFYFYEANSGADCLHKIKEYQPDLILLDLSMPGMDGFETTKDLRKNGYALPIIVLTANAYPSDRVKAINAGCNDFLPKPVKVSELLYKLKLHLCLTWIYHDDDQEIPHTPDLRQLSQHPPANIMDELIAYTRIGDLIGLNQHLTQLCQNHSEYVCFAQRIQLLSNEFRLNDIRRLLNMSNENKPL